jgi:hypothetical protein
MGGCRGIRVREQRQSVGPIPSNAPLSAQSNSKRQSPDLSRFQLLQSALLAKELNHQPACFHLVASKVFSDTKSLCPHACANQILSTCNFVDCQRTGQGRLLLKTVAGLYKFWQNEPCRPEVGKRNIQKCPKHRCCELNCAINGHGEPWIPAHWSGFQGTWRPSGSGHFGSLTSVTSTQPTLALPESGSAPRCR